MSEQPDFSGPEWDGIKRQLRQSMRRRQRLSDRSAEECGCECEELRAEVERLRADVAELLKACKLAAIGKPETGLERYVLGVLKEAIRKAEGGG